MCRSNSSEKYTALGDKFCGHRYHLYLQISRHQFKFLNAERQLRKVHYAWRWVLWTPLPSSLTCSLTHCQFEVPVCVAKSFPSSGSTESSPLCRHGEKEAQSTAKTLFHSFTVGSTRSTGYQKNGNLFHCKYGRILHEKSYPFRHVESSPEPTLFQAGRSRQPVSKHVGRETTDCSNLWFVSGIGAETPRLFRKTP